MAQRQNTDLFRGMTGNLIAGCFALLAATGPALCATAIKIGRTTIPNISHLPIYVDMETGLFGRKGSMPNLSPCRQEPWRPSGWAGNDRFCSTTRFWRQGYPERGRNSFCRRSVPVFSVGAYGSAPNHVGCAAKRPESGLWTERPGQLPGRRNYPARQVHPSSWRR